MTWQQHAADLAASILYPQSRWWNAVTTVPRHLLMPRWFDWDSQAENWELRVGPSGERPWMTAAYSGRTRVTRVGPVHADEASMGQRYQGWPTSSSTAPGLVIAMYRHAQVYDGADILDIGTGTGYGAALLTRRLGAEHVTSIDIDPYLTGTAGARLSALGLRPEIPG